MLFLFVLMLVGVDVQGIFGGDDQGTAHFGCLAGLGFGALLVFAVGNAIVGPRRSGCAPAMRRMAATSKALPR
jgi:NADH-quinone oxidoreductase subunit J